MNPDEWRSARFDIVDLRLFVHIADASSLTRGAEQSFLSLPAASVRIKNLEEALATRLLNRTKRGITLTESGEVLLANARILLADLERLQVELRPYSRGVRGHVRLFANTLAISEVLPSVLARFFDAHGAITVDLQERLSSDVVSAVQEGLADVGVVSANVRTDGLETLPCKKDRLVLAVPANHPLSGSAPVNFADTLDYAFIGLDPRSAIHSFLQQEVSGLGRGMRQRFQVGSFDAMCRMVEANIGIAVVPELAARRHARSLQIEIVQLLDEWATRELRICVRRLPELPVFARELVQFILQDTAEDRQADNSGDSL